MIGLTSPQRRLSHSQGAAALRATARGIQRRDFAYSLNKMRTRGCRVKPIGEILRFVGHQSFAEFHDAHRVRRYAVIAKYEFSDPEIADADNSPDGKTLLVWLEPPALLNVVPTADPLTRLRIIKHSILAVDFMFDLEIARVRSIPMALQRHPHGSIIHLVALVLATQNAPLKLGEIEWFL